MQREQTWHGATERLDIALTVLGLARSRSHAREQITNGKTLVNGTATGKTAHRVKTGDTLTVHGQQYVSRGAHKLIQALNEFHITVQGAHAIDLGASTGGFTQVLLQRKAATVIALDVGHSQLAQEIAQNPRVTVLEKVNARYLSVEKLVKLAPHVREKNAWPTVYVADLSFISLTLILPVIAQLAEHAPAATPPEIVALIKPQFEVGRVQDGIVTDAKLWREALHKVLKCATENDLHPLALTRSLTTGSEGNIEFLARFCTAQSPAWQNRAENRGKWDDEIAKLTGEGG